MRVWIECSLKTTAVRKNESTPTKRDLALWREFIQAAYALTKARGDLFRQSSSLVELMRLGLNKSSERKYALPLMAFLKLEDRKRLFCELLSTTSFATLIATYTQSLILDLPRDWVESNVEELINALAKDDKCGSLAGVSDLHVKPDRLLAARCGLEPADNPSPGQGPA